MVPATRAFFRIVGNDPPAASDFLSYEALGIYVGGTVKTTVFPAEQPEPEKGKDGKDSKEKK